MPCSIAGLSSGYALGIGDRAKPNFVIVIQKEMFRDNFLFDKMEKVELEMVEAYRKRFKAIDPFTEDALLNLARMSRGIFRRFLRYITLTIRHWEIDAKGPIDSDREGSGHG